MPRYFFDLVDHKSRKTDKSGTVFDTLSHARRAAEAAAREIMVMKLLADEDPDGRQYEILNESRVVLDIVRFRDVLPTSILEEWRPDPTLPHR